MPFSYSMSLSVRSGTLFALVKSKGIALMSFIGHGMLGLVLLIRPTSQRPRWALTLAVIHPDPLWRRAI
jgi:hypothetical protein